jgi:hypothetical protein
MKRGYEVNPLPYTISIELRDLLPRLIIAAGSYDCEYEENVGAFILFLSYTRINKECYLLVRDYIHNNAACIPTTIASLIDDIGLLKYTNLRKLVLFCPVVSNQSIEKMTRLRTLSAGSNTHITDSVLSKLTNLKSLTLMCDNNGFDGSSFIHLTKLRELILYGTSLQTRDNIPHLSSSLTSLSLCSTGRVCFTALDNYISTLTNLRELSVGNGWNLVGYSFQWLTGLTFLDITGNSDVRGRYLSYLTPTLKYLLVQNGTRQVYSHHINKLTSLTYLNIGCTASLMEDLEPLVLLEEVTFLHRYSYQQLRLMEKSELIFI